MGRIRNDFLEEVLFDPTPLWPGVISINRDERKDTAEREASWTEAQRNKRLVGVSGSGSIVGGKIGKGK